MTTIAYCDGILASDTMCTDDELQQKYYRPKIRIFKDAVIAESGEDQWIDVFCDWWKAGHLISSRPKIPKGQIGMILIRLPSMKVEMWTDASYGIPITERYCATGSGGPYAMGAMWAGLSAADGVRAAMDHDPGTGGKVRTVDVRKIVQRMKGKKRNLS